ncbi:MAG: NUDIX hydrolase [Gammaproteobacteria bacterium]
MDIVVLIGQTLPRCILLIRRKNPPFEDQWALPGGFVDQDEDLEPAAQRELAEETGITGLKLTQLQTFGKPGRDPRGHTVSIVYLSVLDTEPDGLRAGSDAAEARWFNTDALPTLAFDHANVISVALNRAEGDG